MSLLSSIHTATSYALHLIGADEYSRAERELSALDDEILRDMGICRCEIHDIVLHGRATNDVSSVKH
ncbi:DUF1127 domain-containing protein [Azospirillum canadense]|uniref:DUF1127 domain-containing protein n=1 Tax=Azospirillum canadense TaxID=403962 RepID=UPI002227994A|nr:DUF1127 domain-containing protein [Azospirillum canadense]MCW2241640.1 uncharacterized protein YjiS (DUF1127 family) [Azospirillum canadense]